MVARLSEDRFTETARLEHALHKNRKMLSGLSYMYCSSFGTREMLECRAKVAQSPAYHDIIRSSSATGPQTTPHSISTTPYAMRIYSRADLVRKTSSQFSISIIERAWNAVDCRVSNVSCIATAI